MGRTETGDRIESKQTPSAQLAEAAVAGQAARTETAEEIAQMLLRETERRQPQPEPAPSPPREAPRRQPQPRPASTPRREPPPPPRSRQAPPTQPPPPRRRPVQSRPRPRPEQQQQQRSRRGLGWIVFAAFWLISSIVGVFFSDEGVDTPDIDVSIPTTSIDFSDLTSTTLSASPDATLINIRDVRVGQCIETLPIGSIINDVPVVPCDVPHQYELFANTEIDSDGFPEDVFALAADACIPLFGDYVGEDYFDSTLYIDPIAPTEEGWRVGDRAVNCLLYSWPDGAEEVEYVTGSAEGSGNARS